MKYTNVQIGALADAFGKSVETIKRWIREENTILTSDKAKEALLKIKN